MRRYYVRYSKDSLLNYSYLHLNLHSFNEVVPSLAIYVIDSHEIHKGKSEVDQKVKLLSQQFRNSWVVIVDDEVETMGFSSSWQMKFGSVSTNFLFVSSPQLCADRIQQLYFTMLQKDKMDKQRAFFQQLQNDITSMETARQIYRQTMEILSLSNQDTSSLLATESTMQTLIIHATENKLPHLEERDGLERIIKLFSCRFPGNK